AGHGAATESLARLSFVEASLSNTWLWARPQRWKVGRQRRMTIRRSVDIACEAALATTLFDKIWNDHLVHEEDDGTCLLYVDRHLVDEVDSPQAFAALRDSGLRVKAPEKTLLVADHNVPTSDRSRPNPDPESAAQIAYFAENARLFGLEYFDEF